MFLSTSVVMTTTGAWGEMVLSPVRRPVWLLPRLLLRSRYFWLERALIGAV